MEYDPVTAGLCKSRNGRSLQKRQIKKRRRNLISVSLEDGLPKGGKFPEVAERLRIQIVK